MLNNFCFLRTFFNIFILLLILLSYGYAASPCTPEGFSCNNVGGNNCDLDLTVIKDSGLRITGIESDRYVYIYRIAKKLNSSETYVSYGRDEEIDNACLKKSSILLKDRYLAYCCAEKTSCKPDDWGKDANGVLISGICGFDCSGVFRNNCARGDECRYAPSDVPQEIRSKNKFWKCSDTNPNFEDDNGDSTNTSSGTDTSTGTSTGSETSTSTGTDTGTGTSTGTGTETATGTDTGTGTGTKSNSETGTGTSTVTGTGTGTGTETMTNDGTSTDTSSSTTTSTSTSTGTSTNVSDDSCDNNVCHSGYGLDTGSCCVNNQCKPFQYGNDNNCGSCGNVCPQGMHCYNDVCDANTTVCPSPGGQDYTTITCNIVNAVCCLDDAMLGYCCQPNQICGGGFDQDGRRLPICIDKNTDTGTGTSTSTSSCLPGGKSCHINSDCCSNSCKFNKCSGIGGSSSGYIPPK